MSSGHHTSSPYTEKFRGSPLQRHQRVTSYTEVSLSGNENRVSPVLVHRALLAGPSLRAPADTEIARLCGNSGASHWGECVGIQRAERGGAAFGISNANRYELGSSGRPQRT